MLGEGLVDLYFKEKEKKCKPVPKRGSSSAVSVVSLLVLSTFLRRDDRKYYRCCTLD